MKAMKQIVVAVSLVVISAMAPVVEAQQGVEKAAVSSGLISGERGGGGRGGRGGG